MIDRARKPRGRAVVIRENENINQALRRFKRKIRSQNEGKARKIRGKNGGKNKGKRRSQENQTRCKENCLKIKSILL